MKNNELELVDPTEELRDGYIDFVNDFDRAGEQFIKGGNENFNFAAHLESYRKMAEGIDLAEGWVPGQVYWLVRGGSIIGECNLRYPLTEGMRDFGGNIGYSVRPSERNKGYGTLMLKLVLEKAREHGLDRVLITCAKTNIASVRVIQKNGGVLDSESYSERARRVTQRYWIELRDAES